MWRARRQLALGLSLIALTSGLLLVSDWSGRFHSRAGAAHKKWKVRLAELNNVLDVEETEEGVRAGLRASGLVEGSDYEAKVSNAREICRR